MKLTEDLWLDSQKNELHFWKKELEQDNLDQRQRNAYYLSKMEGHCSLIKDFVEQNDLKDKIIMDLGSGPQGILHVLPKKLGLAVDPLMLEFRRMGYDVSGEDLQTYAHKAENIAQIFHDVDVVFCLNSIDHHQDPKLVIDQIWKVLKKGGDLILLTDLRKEEECDAYHKLPLTEDYLLTWLDDFEIIKTQKFPHGAGNPIVQFIVHAKK